MDLKPIKVRVGDKFRYKSSSRVLVLLDKPDWRGCYLVHWCGTELINRVDLDPNYYKKIPRKRRNTRHSEQDIEIPTWEYCSEKKKEDRTPLEQFIYENEPAGKEGTNIFRKRLKEVVGYCRSLKQDAKQQQALKQIDELEDKVEFITNQFKDMLRCAEEKQQQLDRIVALCMRNKLNKIEVEGEMGCGYPALYEYYYAEYVDSLLEEIQKLAGGG